MHLIASPKRPTIRLGHLETLHHRFKPGTALFETEVLVEATYKEVQRVAGKYRKAGFRTHVCMINPYQHIMWSPK